MSARFSNLSLLLVVILISVSCSNKRMSGDQQIIDGVMIRTYGEETEIQLNPYLVEESVAFGSDQGEDTYMLSRAIPAELGRDGTLYVVDFREFVVHRFASDGSHLGQFGRRGDGPGEFQLLQELILDEDRLYFPDFMRNHVMVTSLEGEFIENIPIVDREFSSPGAARYGPKDDRCFIVKRTNYARRGLDIVDPFFRVTRWSGTLGLIDTPIDTIHSTTATSVDGRSYLPPYNNELPVVVAQTDMPLAWSYGVEFRIEFMDPIDLSRWAVVIPSERTAVNSAMKELIFSNYESRGNVEEARRLLTFPSHLPMIQTLFWDRSGRLWVHLYTDPTITEREYIFQVFSADGRWLFKQTLPSRPYIITENGYYGRSTLEDGSPIIQYFELIGGTRE